MNWCFLPHITRFWTDFHDLLFYWKPIEISKCGVYCTTNIISHTWSYVLRPMLDLPVYRVEDPWCSLVIPWLIHCWISLMSPLGHPWVYGSLQIEIWSVNPWGPWWTTSQTLWGCCISSYPWPLPVLMIIPCLPPTHSSWSPCSHWRVGMMRWSRVWIVASQSLSIFILQWISHQSILKYIGWPWVCHTVIDTSSWFPSSS